VEVDVDVVSELVLDSDDDDEAGAVVLSGMSDAGGGNAGSVSGGGNGATSLAEPRIDGPLFAVRSPLSPPFFFAATLSVFKG
jgi:hypothetical protein